MLTIADLGERRLIERLTRRVGAPPAFVRIGIGDDAAVIEPGRGLTDVITTDMLVEDVHFRRAWTTFLHVGRKAVAVNLSDLAAMGAAPRAILLSLALPPDTAVDDFDALVEGAVAEASNAGAALVGGNLAASTGPVIVDVTALGVAHRRRLLTRSGGRPGDELYVTGSLGAAAAGLDVLRTGLDRSAIDADEAQRACVERYERPVARLRCGRMVAAYRAASAAMDLSDGLADAVRQTATASGAGARVELGLVPVDAAARAWFERFGVDPGRAALEGGEDYELLFAVPTRRRRAFLAAMARCGPIQVTRVGRLTEERGLILAGDGPDQALPEGFTHFG